MSRVDLPETANLIRQFECKFILNRTSSFKFDFQFLGAMGGEPLRRGGHDRFALSLSLSEMLGLKRRPRHFAG